MDNCSHNGDKLYAAVDAYAKAWTENGKADSGFLEYIENPAHVSFPWSMIDKITPRPADSVKKMLEEAGFTDTESIVTSKNTYVAPFVNAEEAEYLVIEDAFPNGRPLLEKAGVMFTARDTVEKVERMKVCTCLNPLHTTLAVYGCLLGYTKISEEMKMCIRDRSKTVRINAIRIERTLFSEIIGVGFSAMLMQVMMLVQHTALYNLAAQHGGDTWQIILGATYRVVSFADVYKRQVTVIA